VSALRRAEGAGIGSSIDIARFFPSSDFPGKAGGLVSKLSGEIDTPLTGGGGGGGSAYDWGWLGGATRCLDGRIP
jgi:hypothetical protein